MTPTHSKFIPCSHDEWAMEHPAGWPPSTLESQVLALLDLLPPLCDFQNYLQVTSTPSSWKERKVTEECSMAGFYGPDLKEVQSTSHIFLARVQPHVHPTTREPGKYNFWLTSTSTISSALCQGVSRFFSFSFLMVVLDLNSGPHTPQQML
jgi:hypothetical protein